MTSKLTIHSIQWTLFVVLNSDLWCCSTSKGTLHPLNVQTNEINSTLERCKSAYRKLTPNQLVRFRDASGKEGSGIYRGNTLWYGSYSECVKLSDSRYCLTIFPGSMSLVQNQTETYHFEWGVCMPNVCKEEDVTKDFRFFMHEVSGIKSVTPLSKQILVRCAEDPEYTASVVTIIVFSGLLVGVSMLATVLGMIKGKPRNTKSVERGGHISMDDDNPNEKTPLLPDVTTKRNDKGLLWEILHSFSVTRNVEFIMNTDIGKSDLTYLHGIRVLSLFWIILFHINNATHDLWPYDNLKDMLEYERQLAPMVLTTAYGVDTFFVLSGLLVMYTKTSKKMKNNGRTNWFKYYFHRFWRLTPTYMFCILFISKLRPFFGAGPVWFMQTDTSQCSDNWWTNLLYINNMVRLTKPCLPHTWYLATDMQLFLLSPIFLLIGYRYKLRHLIGTVGVTILASIIVTACIIADNGSSPSNMIPFARLNFFFRDDIDEKFRMDEAYAEDVYVKPYCRISPYVMGMVVGYILYRHFSEQVKLPMKFVVFMWLFAIALALTDMYAPYSSIKQDPRIWSKAEKAVFGALKWPIWGLCIVWLIFACHYNYAGLIRDILAARFWIPLSHVNYAAYIIHVDIIKVLVYNIETPIHYTSFTTVTYFLSSLVLTYAAAFIITAVVELPFANLEALAWKKWEKK